MSAGVIRLKPLAHTGHFIILTTIRVNCMHETYVNVQNKENRITFETTKTTTTRKNILNGGNSTHYPNSYDSRIGALVGCDQCIFICNFDFNTSIHVNVLHVSDTLWKFQQKNVFFYLKKKCVHVHFPERVKYLHGEQQNSSYSIGMIAWKWKREIPVVGGLKKKKLQAKKKQIENCLSSLAKMFRVWLRKMSTL